MTRFQGLPPVKSIAIGRLLFNKSLDQWHDCINRMTQVAIRTQAVEHIEWLTTMGAPVDMARNLLVAQALEKGLDAIFWLDCDMIVPDDSIVRLVSMLNAGYPVATGMYRRTVAPNELLLMKDDRTWYTIEEIDARAEAEGLPVDDIYIAAGGFSMVHTEVYRAIQRRVGLPWYCNWDFVTNHGQVGEDSFFNYRLHDIGVQSAVDPSLCAVHWPPFANPVPTRPDQPEMSWVKFMKQQDVLKTP